MIHGILKGNKHSYYDFGLIMIDRKIEIPTKNKIKIQVPFMNGSYDLSKLYNSEIYNERKLSYTFRLKGRNIQDINNKYTSIVNWLVNNSKEKLYDDLFPGFYFLAECEGSLNFRELNVNKKYATFEVEFIAYPFRIGEYFEGNNLWDNFNFESDVLQDTKFTVNGYANVNIYNSSAIDIEPTIIASSNFEIIKDNKKYVVEAGESKDYRFKLKKGNNNITLRGNGTIEFRFRKEVL